MATERRVGIRFQFEVEVNVSSAWVESHSMKQIEEQARKDAEGMIRDMLDRAVGDVRLIGELGYRFTLAEQRRS